MQTEVSNWNVMTEPLQVLNHGSTSLVFREISTGANKPELFIVVSGLIEKVRLFTTSFRSGLFESRKILLQWHHCRGILSSQNIWLRFFKFC